MDRLDQLTESLLDRLEGDAGGHPFNSEPTHLDACLACLDRFVALRDTQQGLAAPAAVSRRLSTRLEHLLGRAPADTLRTRLVERARRAWQLRVPAWAVAGMAAVLIAFTWVASHYVEQRIAGHEPPRATVSQPDRLHPARSQTTRTISGVVSAIRDATSNGVEAHVLSLEDATGAMYLLFTWGRPTVRPGDAVEIDALLAASAPGGDTGVYQGVVTEVRRAN